ncbi:uncharacterized protein LOC123227851 [Mangifera indica]|uniref:uncharacterized protein LOC123227851 n=1 Tax=Mangifera indica TaxID=29780 RepID=UPI001CFB2C57|nr:uncharacterized protein LOC123227851 [Mangifera indica]
MASSTRCFLFGLTIFLGILAISTTARPCKTIFISSYYLSFNPQNPNPNPNSNTAGFVTVFTHVRQFKDSPHRPLVFLDPSVFPTVDEEPQIQGPRRRVVPLGYDFSSLRDRTKDILSVVFALLFGVGCGSLTAVAMYLMWTLFTRRNSFEEFSDSDEDDLSSKMGYEKIPAKEAA